MKIRKFVAADMKDALAQVKRDLGADAMIVATRPVRRGLLGNGMEVTAAVDIDDSASAAPTSMATMATSNAASTLELERMVGAIRSEVRSLRSQLRSTHAEPRHDEELRRELRQVKRMLGEMTQNSAGEADQPSLSSVVAGNELSQPSQARVVALIGPTGVGKTTTIAKLAAHAALIEHKSVAIVTLDGFRIGGEEQMRTFADLIGVPLVVCEPQRLGETLAGMSEFDQIFVDTAGRSPRDTAAVSELRSAFAGLELEVHLTLPACSSRATIDSASERLSELHISRLLFTKLDEADGRLEELVRAPARLRHPVSWLTNGQRVPEDIEEATSERLLELATFGFATMEQAA